MRDRKRIRKKSMKNVVSRTENRQKKISMKPEKEVICVFGLYSICLDCQLFCRTKNQFVRFHVKQGMKLTLLTLVVGAVAWALNAFFFLDFFLLYCQHQRRKI